MTTKNTNEKTTEEELEKLNKLFAKRYTDEDEEYISAGQRASTPPIVDDWPQERRTHRLQQFDNNNQRRYPSNDRPQYRNYSNDRQQHRNYSNDRLQYRDYSNDRQQHRNYSNDRQQYRNSSNDDHRQYRNSSSDNRQYRDRSPNPMHRETRR